MDLIARLQAWYAAQCDGDWEHQYGVHIGTLDNPGWLVKIDLRETALEGRPFTEVAERVGAEATTDGAPWIRCVVREGVWRGAGDQTSLPRLLALFLDWAG